MEHRPAFSHRNQLPSAAGSPFPPEGFGIKSLADISAEKQADFEKRNPQVSLWMKIKAALSHASGKSYFTSELQGVSVPRLRGVLLEAGMPADSIAGGCPDARRLVTARAGDWLETRSALAGNPDLGTEFQWEGVPSAFSAHPFLLTMETERAKIEGLKINPCAPAGRKR